MGPYLAYNLTWQLLCNAGADEFILSGLIIITTHNNKYMELNESSAEKKFFSLVT